MRSLRLSAGFASLLSLLAACDGGDPAPGTDAGGGVGDAPGAPSLTCSSFTLCTYAEVSTYATSITPPTGGALIDGTYRLAWVEASDEARAGISEDLSAIVIRDGSFSWSGGTDGELGTLRAEGTNLTFHPTAVCELGAQTDDDDRTIVYGYSATGAQLRLHETISGPDGWEQVWVFVRVASPDEVCELVSSAPSSPGDSAECNALNCFCSYAVEDTLEASACPF